MKSSCGNNVSTSKMGCTAPQHSNPLANTKNGVFVEDTKEISCTLFESNYATSLKRRKDFDENSRRRELILDDAESLNQRMGEYRRQKKTGRYIHIFDTDSDDEEDLEQ
ncbi:unnamed protein product [Cylindrotheca closterium]|uniref:Uncharacterized protein n=1 Tax=Cylindrotheca closterium TaxID=2856 RepID=A0AAD2FTN6_9STRA|nr:unnamed protein product [Cylindrotheca closterium]